MSYSWFQTSQTGGQWYSDTSPFCIPCIVSHFLPSLVMSRASPNGAPVDIPLLAFIANIRLGKK